MSRGGTGAHARPWGVRAAQPGRWVASEHGDVSADRGQALRFESRKDADAMAVQVSGLRREACRPCLIPSG